MFLKSEIDRDRGWVYGLRVKKPDTFDKKPTPEAILSR